MTSALIFFTTNIISLYDQTFCRFKFFFMKAGIKTKIKLFILCIPKSYTKISFSTSQATNYSVTQLITKQ